SEEKSGREAMVLLRSHGLAAGAAARVLRRYGHRTLDVVREHPYRLAEDVTGIGFRTADRIALSLGVRPDSTERAEAAVLHLIAEAAEAEGHVYLPHEELLLRARRLLAAGDATAIERAIEERRSSGAIAIEGEGPERRVYAAFLREAEADAARRLT